MSIFDILRKHNQLSEPLNIYSINKMRVTGEFINKYKVTIFFLGAK